MPTEPFRLCQNKGVSFFDIPFLQQTGLVRATFATRVGGVSEGVLAQSNFSFQRGDTVERVRENYTRFFDACGFVPGSAQLSRQVHGTQVIEAQPAHLGLLDAPGSPTADGLMCDRTGETLIKMSADCPTVYILDVRNRAIALLHSGWRGTLENITAAGLQAMARRYGTRAADCLCAVAPSIGPCCFEVGDDVAETFDARYAGWNLVVGGYDKPHIDLQRCIDLQLQAAGVRRENIHISGLCSYCHGEWFHSHRREKGSCGLLVGALALQ